MDEERIRIFAQSLRQDENRKVKCQTCIDMGKGGDDPSLSIKNMGEYAIYKCHKCDTVGRVNFHERQRSKPAERVEPPTKKTDPTPEEKMSGAKWLEDVRKIPYDKVSAYVEFGSAYFKAASESQPCVEFVYKNQQGRKVYAKFRSIQEKHFTSGPSGPGGTDTLFLTEAIDYNKNYLIITEGEMDALTLKAFGFNAVSMPTGANIKWLAHNQNLLQKFKHILIWFDADSKGGLVSDKLKAAPPKLTLNFTYLNPDKLRGMFPENPDIKDANDIARSSPENMLSILRDVLKNCFERHLPAYVIRPSSLMPSLTRIRDRTYANRIGIDEPSLDTVMSLVPGYAGLVTGIPGHGKSTFLSWYAYRLADKYGKKTVFWSPENDPALLVADLVGMAAGKILPGHAGAAEMSDAEIESNNVFVDDHFRIVADAEDQSDIDTILNQMQAAALDMGGAELYVIDPFNYIKLPEMKNQLDAVKIVYSKIRRFAHANKAFVVLIAHPKKMEEYETRKKKDDMDESESPAGEPETKKYKVPGMYSVSGSADFANMADLGLTVYREENKTKIVNWKSRRPFLGTMGISADLVYQPGSGRFRVLGAGSSPADTYESDVPF